jgi:hypothetical protein
MSRARAKSASFGNIDAAPSGFELASLQVYDYDDDGKDELIRPIRAEGDGRRHADLPASDLVVQRRGVAAYAKAPPVNGRYRHRAASDFDMRSAGFRGLRCIR